ncbi:GntR family transcriptional regulator [Streptacidiphilus cavernicola]|uniref:GntR family transcriptional regulator n=1 Tax=Streptacidiphilus cavernicola TaxID=3342716 RepID=A0ABV6VYV3_9ACTN
MLKYEEIAENLRRRIEAGEFPPGVKLPAGRDLCEQWQVSRATVNKALEVLKADALVVSRQGSGYTVVRTPVARPAGGRQAGTTRAAGMPFTRLGAPSMEYPPPPIAHALGLVAGQSALRRSRLMRLVDGTPHSVVVAWFPADIADVCPKLRGEGAIAEGTTRYVERCTGRRPGTAPDAGVDVESVRLISGEEAELLGTECPAAVHVLVHTSRDQNGEVLVVEEGVTPEGMWERVTKYPMGGSS